MNTTDSGQLYWTMRLGMAVIWIWTAYVSWYLYPHAESIAWLRATGITRYTPQVLAASCLLDLGMGLVSLLYARAWLWKAQWLLVAAYSIIIGVCLPQFLLHPFGPISKNIAVLACLAFLILHENSRQKSHG